MFAQVFGGTGRLLRFNSSRIVRFCGYVTSATPPTLQDSVEKSYKEKVHGKTPRRSVLYVPGNDQRKIEKLSGLKVDCAVLDCEDGVAVNKKREALDNICKCLPEVVQKSTGEICVRINSVSSGLYQHELNAILSCKNILPALMLPKVEKWEEIDKFFACVKPLMKNYQMKKMIKFVIFVETALGIVNLKEIIESTMAYSVNSAFRFEGIVFGSDDFCASIGVERSSHSNELLYARQKIVAYAKAFELQAIDMVYIDYKDKEGLENQAMEGAGMGFTGKQVIHPGQVEIVQKCFSPSPEKIQWAKELTQAFNEHQKAGRGAFSFHGRMIDMPLLKQAESIRSMSELAQ